MLGLIFMLLLLLLIVVPVRLSLLFIAAVAALAAVVDALAAVVVVVVVVAVETDRESKNEKSLFSVLMLSTAVPVRNCCISMLPPVNARPVWECILIRIPPALNSYISLDIVACCSCSAYCYRYCSCYSCCCQCSDRCHAHLCPWYPMYNRSGFSPLLCRFDAEWKSSSSCVGKSPAQYVICRRKTMHRTIITPCL